MPVQTLQFGGGDPTFFWIVPGGFPLQPQVINATFDATGAAVPFLAACDVYSESGYLVSRTFAPIPIAPADVAEVTFAPFLGAGFSATGADADQPTIRRRRNGVQNITRNVYTKVTWDETTVEDTAVFYIPPIPNPNGIGVLLDGVYGVLVRLFWSDNPLDLMGAIEGVDPDLFADYPIVVGTPANNINAATTGYAEFRLAAGQEMSLNVFQTGANPSRLNVGTFMEVRRVGSATLDGRDS